MSGPEYAGAFLDGIDQFDAAFFKISPREAKSMDPQQRLLLELAWEALEHGGIPQSSVANSPTGVFIGICGSEYSHLAGGVDDYELVDKYFGSGTATSVAAGRISYALNLQGPSLAVDTACSSSLVAVHLAVRSLRQGESRLCLVGGVNLALTPAVAVYASRVGALSPRSSCRAFDDAADGYVRGEGGGLVVLKLLHRAIEDNDRVLAVIRGSAINQDGRTAGLTAPNGSAQESVISAALDDGGVSAGAVAYVEAHGTGTPLGDQVEAGALGRAYGQARKGREPLLIGSAKANIGHLEASAGIAGLIKVIMAMRGAQLPPQINIERPNTQIPWTSLGLSLPRTRTSWPPGEGPRTGAVSSFGASGTNAHVVLSQPPPRSPAELVGPSTVDLLLPLSARCSQALRELAHVCLDRLDELGDDHESTLELCRGMALRRTHHPVRLCVAGSTSHELATALRQRLEDDEVQARSAGPPTTTTAFVFSGHGAHWRGMGAALAPYPRAQQIFQRLEPVVHRHLGWSLTEELSPNRATRSPADDFIAIQVCHFAVQAALHRLWRQWGIHPAAVVGSSVGEVAAAEASGAIDLETAMSLVIERATLLARSEVRGGMMVVGLPVDVTERLIQRWHPRLVIAGINSYETTLVSGEAEAIEELTEQLETRDIFHRIVPTSAVAPHSPLVHPQAPRLRAALKDLRPAASDLRIVSTVTGRTVAGPQLDASYWARNLSQPIRFADAITHLAEQGYQLYVEIGAKPVSKRAIEQTLAGRARPGVVVASLHPPLSAPAVLCRGLATLYERGLDPDWSAIYPGAGPWAPPPPYPWQRTRHWLTELAPRDASPPARSPVARLPSSSRDLLREHNECVSAWDDEGVDSINMGQLAPLVVLAPDGSAAFYVDVLERTCVVWAYIGDPARFTEHVGWLYAHCGEHDLRMLLVATDTDKGPLGERGFGSVPLGVLHRIEPLSEFRLSGTHMRRLRSQLARYARSGAGVTAEVHPEDLDDGTRAETLALISSWQQLKGGPVRAVELVYQCLADGSPIAPRRMFLTHTNDRLDSVVLLTPFGNRHGYLLDLEFYSPRCPPGCNEFAIVEIIEKLTREGYRTLSLGGSYVDTHERHTRFKRKFRPREIMLRLYGDQGSLPRGLSVFVRSMTTGASFRTKSRPVASLEDIAGARRATVTSPALHPLVQRKLSLAGTAIVFEGSIDATDSIVAHHRIQGSGVLPGAAVLEMAFASLRLAFPSKSYMLCDLVLLQPIVVEEDAGTYDLQVMLTPRSDVVEFELFSRHDAVTDGWVRCARAEARPSSTCPALEEPPRQGWQDIDVREIYAVLEASGIDYGPSYRGLLSVQHNDDRLRGRVCLPPSEAAEESVGYIIHPAILDASFLALSAAIGPEARDELHLLHSVSQAVLFAPVTRSCVVHARLGDATSANIRTADIDLLTPQGVRVASYRALLTRPAPPFRDVRRRRSVPAVHALDWVESALPPSTSSGPQGWLVAGADPELMRSATARLQSAGGLVRSVPGGSRKACIQALCALRESELEGIDRVVLLPDADSDLASQDPLTAAEVPALARSIAQRLGPKALWIVTRGATEVHPEQHLGSAMADAGLWGLGAVLRNEHPEWWGGLVDLDPDVGAASGAEALVATCGTSSTEDAWRVTSDGVLVPRVRTSRIEASQTVELEADAYYVVTGWSGGIGQALVPWLIRRGARHLVLLARSSPSAMLARRLDDWREAHGVELEVWEFDVADTDQVERHFLRLREAGLAVRGIFHAAGDLSDRLVLNNTVEDFEICMASRVTGTVNLHRATVGMPLRYFMVFSSAVTLFGPPSQGAYAAACAMMDHIVAWRRSQGLPALSIGWGPWASVGAAAELNLGPRLRDLGIESLDPTECMRHFGDLLAADAEHRYVVPVDWERWRSAGGHAAGAALFEATCPRSVRDDDVVEASHAHGGLEDRVQFRAHVVRRLARALMSSEDAIDPALSLEALGLDSIMLVELREQLSADFGVILPLIDFFSDLSVVELCDTLYDVMPAVADSP